MILIKEGVEFFFRDIVLQISDTVSNTFEKARRNTAVSAGVYFPKEKG